MVLSYSCIFSSDITLCVATACFDLILYLRAFDSAPPPSKYAYASIMNVATALIGIIARGRAVRRRAAAAADRMSASRRRRFRDVFTSCCTPAMLLYFCNAV